MDYSAMEQYWIWLASVRGMNARLFYKLLSVYQDPRAVWDAAGSPLFGVPESLSASIREARDEKVFFRLFLTLEKLECRALLRIEDDYPACLSETDCPPPVLFVRGDADLSHPRAIAIVGTRHPTSDGRRAAREFARTLSENGVTVVSGLAYGVDAAAHQGAMEGNSPTIAVLGSSIDSIEPRCNEQLGLDILEKGGCLLSEYAPGMAYQASNYPLRNRIISALSKGTLLVEGAHASGAKITVNYALEQGRDVFAIPGSIYSPESAAPNRLLADGAQMALDPYDILEYYRWAARPSRAKAAKKAVDLSPEEQAIVRATDSESKSFDEIARETGIETGRLAALLSFLELKGGLEKAPGGLYRSYL